MKLGLIKFFLLYYNFNPKKHKSTSLSWLLTFKSIFFTLTKTRSTIWRFWGGFLKKLGFSPALMLVAHKNHKRPYLFWWARLSNLIFSSHLALLWNFLLTLLLSSRMLIKLDFFRLRHVTILKPATKVKAFYLLKDYHVYWCHISNTDRAVLCMIVTGYYHEYSQRLE